MLCNICPRECGVDRSSQNGACGMGDKITVARASLHRWEEPCISGTNGSGTVFFSGCNLKCLYCQNRHISHDNFGMEVTESELMRIFDRLIEQGASNLNLVTPTHFALQIASALKKYNSPVPVVYNTSAYEKVETLRLLEGLVDIYLPDIKYIDSQRSKKYSLCPDYFHYASRAVTEMLRQTGSPVLDEKGLMKKGTIIRHLVLPKNTNQTIKIIDWLSDNIPHDTFISLMSQYTPVVKSDFEELNRRLTKREYQKVKDYLFAQDFVNIYFQEGECASESFIPHFDLTGLD